jgi:hypothetical protein
MIINPQVPLHRLILSLSQVLDYVHPSVIDHQQRVAYIAMRIARQLGVDKNQLLDLLLAAALHDIGIIGDPGIPKLVSPCLAKIRCFAVPPKLFVTTTRLGKMVVEPNTTVSRYHMPVTYLFLPIVWSE